MAECCRQLLYITDDLMEWSGEIVRCTIVVVKGADLKDADGVHPNQEPAHHLTDLPVLWQGEIEMPYLSRGCAKVEEWTRQQNVAVCAFWFHESCLGQMTQLPHDLCWHLSRCGSWCKLLTHARVFAKIEIDWSALHGLRMRFSNWKVGWYNISILSSTTQQHRMWPRSLLWIGKPLSINLVHIIMAANPWWINKLHICSWEDISTWQQCCQAAHALIKHWHTLKHKVSS